MKAILQALCPALAASYEAVTGTKTLSALRLASGAASVLNFPAASWASAWLFAPRVHIFA